MLNNECRVAVIRRIQEKLPDVPSSVLEECVDRAAEYFCSKTKRKQVPLTAIYLWVDMAMRLHGRSDTAGSEGKLTSIKRGDTTLQYSDTAVAEAMTDIDGRIMAYKVVRLA